MIKSAQMIQLVKLLSDVVPPVLSCVTGPTCWPPRDDPSPVGIHFNRQTMINELKMSKNIFEKFKAICRTKFRYWSNIILSSHFSHWKHSVSAIYKTNLMYNTSFYYILYIIMLSWNLLRYWSCARRRTSTASCSVWWLWIDLLDCVFNQSFLYLIRGMKTAVSASMLTSSPSSELDTYSWLYLFCRSISSSESLSLSVLELD